MSLTETTGLVGRQATLLPRVGKDGPKILAVCFGLFGVSIAYGSTESVSPTHSVGLAPLTDTYTNPYSPDEKRLKLLDRAWELGCPNWDTADIYGDSEDLIGKWFQLHLVPQARYDRSESQEIIALSNQVVI
ncbi:hypothetical protein EDB81DRAFT_914466 [Dactylonectria macrodidyma]|uniref:NADP-dependent oxidoreductase domain-containing protein n=1 Tax=Dactylonectria macrodidyma TaxID=307937 RepID=A0A9P9DK63_9HYPO|nr:hypothetical protein EDB81DRAFT_914466 [Dactylonectria macrodidyma]